MSSHPFKTTSTPQQSRLASHRTPKPTTDLLELFSGEPFPAEVLDEGEHLGECLPTGGPDRLRQVQTGQRPGLRMAVGPGRHHRWTEGGGMLEISES